MSIIDKKGIIKVAQINLTNHAFERYLMRVNQDHSREQAKTWVAQALNKGKYVSKQKGGNEIYVYNGTKLVIDKHMNIVTIMTDQEADWESIKDTREDIEQFIIRKLNREAKPLIQKCDNIQINIYEKEISKLKARNPETQSIIQKDIDTLINDKKNVENKLEGICKTAKKYYIEPQKVHKRLGEIK